MHPEGAEGCSFPVRHFLPSPFFASPAPTFAMGKAVVGQCEQMEAAHFYSHHDRMTREQSSP